MTDNTGSADAGNPDASASVTTAATGTTAAPSAVPPAAWYGDLADADLKGMADLKGWKSPADVLTSYRTLEQHIGVPPDRIIKLPEAGDTAGLAAVHAKLGFAAPATAADYGLAQIDGFDPTFAAAAGDVFLKHGVPKDMASGAMKEVGGLLQKMEADYESQRATQFANEMTSLKTEWGANFEPLQETAKRAAAEYMPKAGLAVEDLDSIREAIGPAKFNKLWAGIGSTMGESAFVAGGTQQALGAMTPAAAVAKRAQLAQDPAWIARYQGGDIRAVNEWKQVNDTLAAAAASSGVIR